LRALCALANDPAQAPAIQPRVGRYDLALTSSIGRVLKYTQPGPVAAIAAQPTFNPKNWAFLFQRRLPGDCTGSMAGLEKNTQWLSMADNCPSHPEPTEIPASVCFSKTRTDILDPKFAEPIKLIVHRVLCAGQSFSAMGD
jgi:hypothetical protein